MTGYVLYIFFLSYGHFSCSCSSISQIQGVADVDTPTHAIFRCVQTKKSMVKQSTIDTQSHPSLHTSFYTPPYTHCHCQHSHQPSHCPSHYPMTIMKKKTPTIFEFLEQLSSSPRAYKRILDTTPLPIYSQDSSNSSPRNM